MFAKNLSRREAFDEEPVENSCFINIQEPAISGYPEFDTLPLKCKLSNLETLNLSFADVARPFFVELFCNKTKTYKKHLVPLATDEDIKNIYEFIVKNRGKNVYVNCMAGVSRSGAIATFLHDFFDYELVAPNKDRISPNGYILHKLCFYHFNKIIEEWEKNK